jgi:plastocyanin
MRSRARQAASPEETVLIGLGQREVSQGSALSFTPKYLDITVGDTVLFKDIDALEPHTVTFGPMSLLKQLVDRLIMPMPQKNGSPLLAINARAFRPTMGHTYDGTGLANSGFLRAGQSWSLTFTKPGAYKYVCVVHGFTMSGAIIVHPQQPMGKMYIVQAGDGLAALQDKSNATTNDAFYPVQVTVHTGDAVEWIGGFHTVSFGPPAMIHQLEQSLFAPVPQKSGPPILALNPKVAFPSGGARYDGTGYANSGILALQVPPGSKAPPTYRLTFTKPGTYKYYCLLHPGMDGTIVVRS